MNIVQSATQLIQNIEPSIRSTNIHLTNSKYRTKYTKYKYTLN